MSRRAELLAELTAPGEPHELRDHQGIRGTERVFASAPATLRDLLDGARSDLDYYVYEGRRLTFADAADRSAALARVLVGELGVGPGDRVAVSMRNHPEWVLGLLAAASVGAVAVAMNSLWTAEELHYGLRDSGARVLLADGERVAQLGESAADADGLAVLAVAADDGQLAAAGRPVGDLRAVIDHSLATGSGWPDQQPRTDDPATIFYTSGSTGHPKGVLSTHRNVIGALLSWELDTILGSRLAAERRRTGGGADLSTTGRSRNRSDRPVAVQPAALLGVPLFHVTGCHAVALLSLRAQRKVVAMHRWDPELAAGLIEAERINSFVATPAMTGDLLRVAAETGHDLSSLRLVGGGGAPRPPEQVRRISTSFAKAAPNNGWGMTETNAIGAGITGPEYLERPDTSGRSSAILDLRVVGEDGEPLSAGVPGELQVRGSSVFVGYWNRPEDTEASFDGPWFRTGDVARIDDEGFVTIVDRIKDLIIRGGENIGCGHVEAAILMHPLAREAAVYGIPDERLGEEVGATVYGAPGLDPDELQAFLADHLGRFEIPQYLTVTLVPLPRTATGKILKRRLRDEALRDLRAAGLLR